MQTWEKIYLAPINDSETQPFWAKARAGKFLIKRCLSCEKPHWYPRSRCPFCLSANTEWGESKGTGSIYSYSVMRRATQPYIVAFVTLDEGPTVLTNLVECDPTSIRIGMRVSATFRCVSTDVDDGTAIPVFRPLPSSEETKNG